MILSIKEIPEQITDKKEIARISREGFRNITVPNDFNFISRLLTRRVIVVFRHLKDGIRTTENALDSFDTLCYDIDTGNVQQQTLEDLPFYCYFQETMSSTPDNRRWRLIIPIKEIDKRLSKEEFLEFNRLVGKQLPFEIDTNATDIVRFLIFTKNPLLVSKSKKTLDNKSLLKLIDNAKGIIKKKSINVLMKQLSQHSRGSGFRRMTITEAINNKYVQQQHEEAQPGHRNLPAFKIVSFLTKVGLSENEIVSVMKSLRNFDNSDYQKISVIRQQIKKALE